MILQNFTMQAEVRGIALRAAPLTRQLYSAQKLLVRLKIVFD